MSKKTNFNDEMLVDQPDIGCYYPTNMFRFPEEEMNRPMPPQMKTSNSKAFSQSAQPMTTPVAKPSLPADDEEAMLSPTLSNIGYTQAYLKSIIGKYVRVSFLIGTSLLVDRVGTLVDVGISYIVLKQVDSNTNVMCDLYSIKFVDIYSSKGA